MHLPDVLILSHGTVVLYNTGTTWVEDEQWARFMDHALQRHTLLTWLGQLAQQLGRDLVHLVVQEPARSEGGGKRAPLGASPPPVGRPPPAPPPALAVIAEGASPSSMQRPLPPWYLPHVATAWEARSPAAVLSLRVHATAVRELAGALERQRRHWLPVWHHGQEGQEGQAGRRQEGRVGQAGRRQEGQEGQVGEGAVSGRGARSEWQLVDVVPAAAGGAVHHLRSRFRIAGNLMVEGCELVGLETPEQPGGAGGGRQPPPRLVLC